MDKEQIKDKINQDSLGMLMTTFNDSNVDVWVANSYSGEVWVSKSMSIKIGVPYTDSFAMDLRDFRKYIYEPDLGKVMAHTDNVISGKHYSIGCFRIFAPDGSLRLAEELTIAFNRMEDGTPEFLINFLLDSNPCEEAEQNISEAVFDKMTIELLYESNPHINILFNDNFDAIECNPAAISYFGVDTGKQEFLNTFNEIIKSHNYKYKDRFALTGDLLITNLKKAADKGSASYESPIMFPDGERVVSVIMTKIPFEDTFAILTYVSDITKLKNVQEKGQRLSDLLETESAIAHEFLSYKDDGDFEIVMWNSLKRIGELVNAQRAYIWENYDVDGELYCRQTYEWSEGVEPQQGKDFSESMPYVEVPNWKKWVESGTIVNGPIKNIPLPERDILGMQGIKSVLIIPLNYRGKPWGFVGLDDCENERSFTGDEQRVLSSCGSLLTSSIVRNYVMQNLAKTRETLIRRDKMLETGNKIAEILLAAGREDFDLAIEESLGLLSECVEADIVSIWRNISKDDGSRYAELLSMYGNKNVPTRLNKTKIKNWDESDLYIDYETLIPMWHGTSEIKEINLDISTVDKKMAGHHTLKGVKYLSLVPVFVKGGFWGFLSFAHRRNGKDNNFSETENSILRSGGVMIASAYMNNEMSAELIDMTGRAISATRAKSDFLSRMSHEMRTPMNAIMGMTNIAKTCDDKDKIKDCIEKRDKSSHKMLSLINNVLDMSKIEDGRFSVSNVEFDFDHMLQNVLRVISVNAEEKHQGLTVKLKKSFERKVIMDELRISQVLINVLGNAIKFTPDFGRIELQIEVKEIDGQPKMFFAVVDNGIGIAEENQKKIFDSFENANDTIRKNYGGSGLGLVICREILTRMGGDIFVESREGEGSVFKFNVDFIWGSLLSDDTEDVAIANETIPDNIDLTNVNILAVEDIEINREIVTAMLSNTNADIDIAVDGVKACELVEKNPGKYDVILMDIQMPNMDGYEATRKIRTMYDSKSVPIIAMTANSYPEDVKACLEAGMNDHMAKPLDFDSFLTTVSKWASKKGTNNFEVN